MLPQPGAMVNPCLCVKTETGTALPRSPVLTPRLPWQGMLPALFHRAGNGIPVISVGPSMNMSGNGWGRIAGRERRRGRVQPRLVRGRLWTYSFGTRRC